MEKEPSSVRRSVGSVRGERAVVSQSDDLLEVFEEKEPSSVRRSVRSVRGERAVVSQTICWKCSRRKSRSDEHLEVFVEKEPSSIRRTVGTVSRATLGKVKRRDGAPNYGVFRAHRYHLGLNWTELTKELKGNS